MNEIIYITSLALLLIFQFVIFFKYIKLKSSLKSYEEIGTGRYGFYKYMGNYSSYNAYVYVKEIDRYTDGYSKIKIDKIEALSKNSESDAISKATYHFVSLRLTSDMEW